MSFEFTPANKVFNSNITAAFSYVLLLVSGGSGKLRNIQFDVSLDCMTCVHKYIGEVYNDFTVLHSTVNCHIIPILSSHIRHVVPKYSLNLRNICGQRKAFLWANVK